MRRKTTDLKEVKNETKPETKEWTILSAMENVYSSVFASNLTKEFWEENKEALDFLTEKLELTKMQVVLLSVLAENEDPMNVKEISRELGCMNLHFMKYMEEIKDLLRKRWLIQTKRERWGNNCRSWRLAEGVMDALVADKKFIPEKIDGMDLRKLVKRLASFIVKIRRDGDVIYEEQEDWLVSICKANLQHPLCEEIESLEPYSHAQALLILMIVVYYYNGQESEGVTRDLIEELFPSDFEYEEMEEALEEGSHILFKKGFVEFACEDGIVNNKTYVLTRKFKEDFLAGITPNVKVENKNGHIEGLKDHKSIHEKTMFYNDEEKAQIDKLTSLLGRENLKVVQDRLQQQGMRKGFACLFYGSPGTGKTETVLQIARQTGRDIMQIDLSQLRDKFIGESEKNIRAIFQKYNEVCKQSKEMPILFFNEADAIFGKRTSVSGANPSVEKMENAIQDIILEEMENLEGILIATTNLETNLDCAFERRFLFKIEFRKPNISVKQKLWRSMLNGITEKEALQLAQEFDFSGGQIENIVRKETINFVLNGQQASLEEIENFCKAETLSHAPMRRAVGFQ